MRFAIATLIYEWRRYLAGVLSVGFSTLLIAMQVGLLLGLIGVVSVPIINSKAQVWAMFPNTPACDLARPIPLYWRDRLWANPDVIGVDQFIQGFGYWRTPTGATQLIIVLGLNLDESSLGPIARLTPEQRVRLTEPNAVILDVKDAKKMEVHDRGEFGEVSAQRVRVVGFTQGMGAITGPYVICSLETARRLLRLREDQTTYLLATCRTPEAAAGVVKSLNHYPDMTAYLSDDFSTQSKVHWIRKTKAGVALGFAALLGLLVGGTITSQTLYGAVLARLRELAVLRALGIPRWRLRVFVVSQALLVGLLGLAFGLPATYGLAHLATQLGTTPELPWWLVTGASTITLVMSLLAGLWALRSLRLAEPAQLLR